MPYVLKNLIKDAVEEVNEKRDPASHPLEDPTPTYIEVLDLFNQWFCTSRSSELNLSEVMDFAELGSRLQAKLLEVFPDKTGIVHSLECH